MTNTMVATLPDSPEGANQLANLFYHGDLNALGVKDAIGVYEREGQVYVVQPNRVGTHVYAKVWDNGHLEYTSGAINLLHPCHKVTRERGEELSAQIGACIRCGRILTAAKSVRASIGPVCAKYFA